MRGRRAARNEAVQLAAFAQAQASATACPGSDWCRHDTQTLMLTLTEPNSAAEFGGAIVRLLEAHPSWRRRRWKRAVIHWFWALEISPSRNG